jgi:hypothetical protein
MDKSSAILLKKKIGSGMHSDTKLGPRGGVILLPQKKEFWNDILVCVLLRKNFQNGLLVRYVTKIPLDKSKKL